MKLSDHVCIYICETAFDIGPGLGRAEPNPGTIV